MTGWRTGPVTIQGRPFTLGDVHGGKLYHGSPRPLPVGTILEPDHGANFTQSDPGAVSVTSDPQRAAYWAQEATGGTGPGHVYEVEPIGHVTVWRAGLADYGRSFTLWEGRTPAARITA